MTPYHTTYHRVEYKISLPNFLVKEFSVNGQLLKISGRIVRESSETVLQQLITRKLDGKAYVLRGVWCCWNESTKLRALRALAPTRLTDHWYAPYAPVRLRAYLSYPSLIRACLPLLTNKRLRHLFLSCVVVSIVSCGWRLKNPRKATGPDFIPLKVIKFASDVIDSHLYNIII